MEKGKFEGTWAIVANMGIQYIGRIIDYTTEADVNENHINLEEVYGAKWIHLCPVYEFVCPIIPSPQGLQRLPTVMPIGVCLEEVGIRVRWTSILFFEDMSEGDRKTYQDMISNVENHMKESRLKRVGIVKPSVEQGVRGRA